MKTIIEKQGLEHAWTKETRLSEMNELGTSAECDRDHLHGCMS